MSKTQEKLRKKIEDRKKTAQQIQAAEQKSRMEAQFAEEYKIREQEREEKEAVRLKRDIEKVHKDAIGLIGKNSTLKIFLDELNRLDPSKAALNIKTPEGETLLTLAIKEGFGTVVETILNAGASPNTPSTESYPLEIAVKKSDSQIVNTLLRNKAQPLKSEGKGLNLIHYLLQNFPEGNFNELDGPDKSKLEILQSLVESMPSLLADLDYEGYTPVMRVVSLRQENLLNLLLKYKPNLNIENDKGNNALELAVVKLGGLLPKTEIYYKTGAYKRVIDALIKNGADIKHKNKNGETPLFAHIKSYYMDASVEKDYGVPILDLLINKYQADINTEDYEGLTPLTHALKVRNETLFKSLLALPQININYQNKDGQTPLTIYIIEAIENPNDPDLKKNIQFLMQSGASLKIKDNKGKTALDYLIEANNQKIMDLFKKYDLDIDQADANGDSLLISYIKAGKPTKNIEFLLKNGANALTYDANGSEALNIAASKGFEYLEIMINNKADIKSLDAKILGKYIEDKAPVSQVEFLLENGIDPDTKYQGQNVLNFAVKQNANEYVEALLKNRINIELVDNLGSTPLINAAKNNNPITTQLLLDNKASVLSVDMQGNNVLLTSLKVRKDLLGGELKYSDLELANEIKNNWQIINILKTPGEESLQIVNKERETYLDYINKDSELIKLFKIDHNKVFKLYTEVNKLSDNNALSLSFKWLVENVKYISYRDCNIPANSKPSHMASLKAAVLQQWMKEHKEINIQSYNMNMIQEEGAPALPALNSEDMQLLGNYQYLNENLEV